jgi:hypothetical protein
LKLVPIPAATHELGWRFSLPKRPRADPDVASLIDEYIAKCSPHRHVDLPSFEIARNPIPLADLTGDPYDLPEEVETLVDLCDFVDERLAAEGLRLPSEDELEASVGGSLFAWGMKIPDGIPYEDQTPFKGHRARTASGLQLLGDPYKVELTRHALKLGDGGSAICGGEPWPAPWLALSPSFRLTDEDIADCFIETLEECYVRPVRDSRSRPTRARRRAPRTSGTQAS